MAWKLGLSTVLYSEPTCYMKKEGSLSLNVTLKCVALGLFCYFFIDVSVENSGTLLEY